MAERGGVIAEGFKSGISKQTLVITILFRVQGAQLRSILFFIFLFVFFYD